MATKKAAGLKIKLVKSTIGAKKDQIATANALGLFKIGGVASISAACNAESFNLLACCLKTCCHIVVENEVGECDVSAFRGEFHSDSLSDAAGCSSDEGSLTCK